MRKSLGLKPACMKRYRIINVDFDSRAALLAMEIREEWEEKVKDGHRASKDQILAGLKEEYGTWAFEAKVQNFTDIGSKPWSVLAFHNRFAGQVRAAFVIGAYYPALTAACALGERILNHLILLLREDYRGTVEYKRVYRKESFDDWGVPIDTLSSWGVLLPDALKAFQELTALRNRTIHFHPETDRNDRALALEAVKLLDKIIDTQFGFFGNQPWFIPNVPGASYIRRAAEQEPFVKRVYLPNGHLVGPCHTLEFNENRITVHDIDAYPEIEISDEHFRDLLHGGSRRAEAPCHEA
jgi:hypothetical protein